MPFSFTSSLVIESFDFRLLWWMQPRAASCRQDHRGKHDSSKTCHSSNQCFHGPKFQSTYCCMARKRFDSVHCCPSWCILDAPRQPRWTCLSARPTSVRSKPVSSLGRVYKPSSEQTRFLHRCGSSQDLRLCFCSTFEQLANFWLRYSQSNSSFWNASSHWGRDLFKQQRQRNWLLPVTSK